MAKELVSGELWEIMGPLLPEAPPKLEGCRPRLDEQASLTGIIFVLKSGIPREMLPQEMGLGSGVTCRRRLKEWQEAGLWGRLLRTCLGRRFLLCGIEAHVDSRAVYRLPVTSRRAKRFGVMADVVGHERGDEIVAVVVALLPAQHQPLPGGLAGLLEDVRVELLV